MAEPRVLHVNDQSRWGGGEGQTWLLIRELERLGIENHALVCAGSPLAMRLATILPPPRLHLLPRALWILLPLALLRLRRGADVVHAHTGRATQAFARAAGLLKVAHRRIPDSPGPTGLKRLAQADAIVCVSDEIRRRLAATGLGEGGRPRLETVHSAAELPLAPPPSRKLEGSPVLGYLGYFRHHKGLDLLLRALPEVLARHPRLVLHLVGEGDEEQALRALARELGLGAAIRFHPFQSDPAGWLAGLDLFVLPSREEGLGSVALQAQALGVPVLGTRAGGISEGVSHGRTGWLVEAGESGALAKGLLELLADPAGLRAYGAAGPDWVREHFAPEAMARRTLQIYRELRA